MSITSNTIKLTVEPKVASIVLFVSTTLNAGTPNVPISVNVYDSANNPVPNVDIVFYGVTMAGVNFTGTNIQSTGRAVAFTAGTTNSAGVINTSVNLASFSFTSGGYSSLAIQAYNKNSDILSGIHYVYPNCTIDITSDNSAPEVGVQFKITATVKGMNGVPFGTNSTTTLATIMDFGYVNCQLFVNGVKTGSTIATNSSGEAVFDIIESSSGTDSFNVEAGILV